MSSQRSTIVCAVSRGILIALLLVAALSGCGGDDDGGSGDGPVGDAVEEHLRYLDPHSSAVFAVDVRYEGRNWKHLRDVASRALRAYRNAADAEDRAQIPPNLTGALNLAAGYVGLSFDDDVKPLLDGYAVVGLTQPPVPPLPEDIQALRRKPRNELTAAEENRILNAQGRQDDAAEPRTVAVYRTEGEGLRDVVEKLAEGETPKPLEGHDDVVTIDNVAVVGDDTLLAVEGADDAGKALREALDRAEEDGGFPSAKLADAEKATALDDPFALAAGDRTIARAWVDEPSLERAFAEVPWLGAIRSVSGGVRSIGACVCVVVVFA